MLRTDGAARRITRVLRCAFWLLLLGSVSCGRSSAPTIRLDTTNPARTFIEVSGLSRTDLSSLSKANLTADEWNTLLHVAVRSSASRADDAPTVAGRYTIEDSLRFWPSFPLDAGREYDVRFDPSKVSRAGVSAYATTATVSLPASARVPSTFVDAVYPSGDVMPENLLRMYVHFSASMGKQGGLDHLAFFDDTGRELPDVVVPLDTELWNGERTRYTVILDPGRVKREIRPNRQMGRALHEGTGITLVVKRTWPDAHGLPMTTEFRHRYRIGPPEQQPLSTASWHVTAPASGSRDPLTVTFTKPLDFGLLQRSLSVRRGDTTLSGEVRIVAGETRWEFVPRSEWQRGAHIITVEPILEDLAGNRIGRAFEVLSRGDALPADSAVPVLVPFIVR